MVRASTARKRQPMPAAVTGMVIVIDFQFKGKIIDPPAGVIGDAFEDVG